MEEVKDVESMSVEVPDEVITRVRLNRLSDIFGRMMVAAIILVLVAVGVLVLFPIMFGMVYVLVMLFALIAMGLIIIFTFGTAFLMGETGPLAVIWDFVSSMSDSAEFVTKLIDIVGVVVPVTCVVGLVAATLSMVLAIVGKNNKKTSKMVSAIVCMVVLVIFILLRILGGELWVG